MGTTGVISQPVSRYIRDRYMEFMELKLFGALQVSAESETCFAVIKLSGAKLPYPFQFSQILKPQLEK